jgi:hypothetical protein
MATKITNELMFSLKSIDKKRNTNRKKERKKERTD